MSPGWEGVCRPVGFLMLMLGFGLRLDTGWQGVAWLVLLAGAGLSVAGLWSLSRGSVAATFVSPDSKQ